MLDMSVTSKEKGDNEVWTDTHISLVDDLQKRGSLWRYSAKHLKLWTDQMVSGKSGGVNDEPKWEDHISAVSLPPKSKKSPSTKGTIIPQVATPTATSNNLLEMMMLQQQKRSDYMQTALLACLTSSPAF